MSLRMVILIAVLGAVLVPLAHGATRTAAAPLTTEPDVYTDVNVTITDRKITLSDRGAMRGDGINFHVKNTGTRAHNFTLLGQGAISLSSSGLGTGTLKPGQTSILSVYMDLRGAIPYRSTVKGDATRIAMRGIFRVS